LKPTRRRSPTEVGASALVAARGFVTPRVFSIPAALSLFLAMAVGSGVLGGVALSSVQPLQVTGNLHGSLVPEASLDVSAGTYRQSSTAPQLHALNRYYLVLCALALAVLTIAGLNLAILLRNRAASRSHEEAIRMALGASPWRRFLERLAGMVVVFGTVAVAGFFTGALGRMALGSPAPASGAGWGFPANLGLAAPVLVLFLVVVFGPAVRGFGEGAARGGTGGILAGGNRIMGARHPEGIRLFFPSIQIALSVTLLMGSSLLLQGTFDSRDARADPAGAGGLLRIGVEARAPGRGGSNPGPDWEGLLADLRGQPGIRDAAFLTPGAWLGLGTTDAVFTQCGDCVVGGMWLPFYSPFVQIHLAGPASFRAMGLRMLEGREFTEADRAGAPLVAIVNESYAREHFDAKGPLHKALGLGRGQDSWHEVIGVVEDFGIPAIGSSRTPKPTVYLSVGQHPPDRGDLYLRPVNESTLVGTTLSARVQEGDLFRVVAPPVTLNAYLENATAPLHRFAWVSLALGLLTLGISVYGLYAVLDFSVTLRREEIGVRRALGGGRRQIRSLTLRRSAGIFLLGAFLGLEGSLFLSSAVEGIAFRGAFFNLPLFLAFLGLMALAAFFGTLRPTTHALAVPPKVAMES